jgi:2-oxoisovalerate dehydrogenase E2 component (dihydrolipoyl transacylase)
VATFVVKLPDVGEGVAEAEVVDWHVTVGDAVEEDQPLADVMTDKATVELPSPVSGTIAKLGAEVGDVVAVGSDLIWIETEVETTPAPDGDEPDSEAATRSELTETRPENPPPVAEAVAPAPAAQPRRGTAPLAAPAVRRRAAALGLDLAAVDGSGPDGRVVHEDLDRRLTSDPGRARAAPAAVASVIEGTDEIESVKVIGLRRNIAKRMQESTRRIPHFTYVDEVDVTDVERLRAELNGTYEGARPRLTLLPLLMRAVVIAVADYPEMNARFRDDEGIIDHHRAVHLGIATQTRKGLMVPVVANAQAQDVWQLAAEVARLSAAARDGSVTLQELQGSTITITSLGALGGVVSTPVINYPEVAIIGVNKIVTSPKWVDGAWSPRSTMNLSSSFDHRVIDGWVAAEFVQRIKALLETPALLFVT